MKVLLLYNNYLIIMLAQTTITQKSQITIPAKFRKALNINKYDKINLELTGSYIKITPVNDIFDIAGKYSAKNGQSAIKARNQYDKSHERI